VVAAALGIAVASPSAASRSENEIVTLCQTIRQPFDAAGQA
jgi:hypothetical protein